MEKCRQKWAGRENPLWQKKTGRTERAPLQSSCAPPVLTIPQVSARSRRTASLHAAAQGRGPQTRPFDFPGSGSEGGAAAHQQISDRLSPASASSRSKGCSLSVIAGRPQSSATSCCGSCLVVSRSLENMASIS